MVYCRCGAFIHPSSDPCTATPTSSSGMIYTGPNLTVTGINNGDTITVALQKIEEYLRSNTTTTTTTTIPSTLTLEFDDIANASLMIGGDATSVTDWNTFFDLPTNGTPFTDIVVIGNAVGLSGGSGIHLKDICFDNNYTSALLTISGTSITSTGQNCFASADYQGCPNLTTVNFPNVIELGFNCFSNCTSLTTINLPNATTLGEGCFFNCTALTTIDLSSTVTLGASCFHSCTYLVTLDLPSAITLGDQCFNLCIALTTILIPNVSVLSTSCFNFCSGLIMIDLPSIISIGDGCFNECTGLTTVNLIGVTTVGDYCFNNCISLETLTLSDCQNLGITTGDDGIFTSVSGNTITLTVPGSLMICNTGAPDGDIVYLQNNNTVTIVQV